MKLKCVACSHPTTWDESFGRRNHLYCPSCFEKKAKDECGGDFWEALQKVWDESQRKV